MLDVNMFDQLKIGLLGHRLFDPMSVDLGALTLGGAGVNLVSPQS